MSIDIEHEDSLDSALSGQSQDERLLQSAADSLRGYAVDLKLSHTLESGEWPDGEESAKAHHDHMMALAKGLDELRVNRQGILDSSGCELKPCPFCGAKAEVKGGLEAQENYSVWCENLHHMDGGYDREKLVAKWNRRAIPAITPEMIEAGAQRLVAWEGDSEWPDSWDILTVAAARNDAERVLRSALNVRADHIADDRKMVASEREARTQAEPSSGVPEGWRLVPVEPTEEMTNAAMEVLLHRGDIYENQYGEIVVETITPRHLLKAMLTAAPQPAEQQPQQDVARLIICDECHAKCADPCAGLFASHCPDEEPCIMCECSSLRRQLAEQQPAPDVASLVEALEASTHRLHEQADGEDDCRCSQCRFVRLRDAALAAHRKQQENK